MQNVGISIFEMQTIQVLKIQNLAGEAMTPSCINLG